ncbi:MAG: Endoglucanase precursor [Labilithrix sp.]|nr:Endoglucanase precursor [Labilithrix sp.]
MRRTFVGRLASPNLPLVLVAFVALVALSCSTRQESPSAPAPTPVIASGVAAKEIVAPAPAPTVKLVGRFDRSDPATARFAWSGSTIVGRFKGTGIRARLRDDGKNLFQVIVDGEPKQVMKTDHTKEVYSLAEGLPDGVHEVAIYKRTEAKVGEVAFLGFEPQGSMLPPPPLAERRMEVIGDSITAGYGNEGPGAVCTFNPAEENHYTTYGAVAARALNAENVTVAWSGKTIGEMTELYERTLPARPESAWDFKAWTPQLVVMNIGTNNFATYDPGETRYVRIYTNLFDRVRKAYPQALIVCLLGPMLTDVYPPGKQNLTLARKYMKAAMAKVKASGETNFEYIDLGEQNHANGLGCGFHPSVKTHKLMADRVVTVAKERLGW